MITVQYPSNQDGLRLRDVKRRLTTLRGQGIGHSFSWSYKRNYRSTFIWNDLSDDDVIYPLRGSGEYLLKASELIDTFANKPEPESKFQNERKQNSADRHPRTMSVSYLSVGDLKDDSAKQGVVAIDTPQSLPPLSVEQETIDVEKSDFCLSSSDNEISPRPLKMADSSKPANNHDLVVMRKSPTVQGLQTPPLCNSPAEAPVSPGSARRLWKREIRKSLFRTRNTNASSPYKRHENVCENPTVQGESPVVESSHEDASLWKDSRSKSVNTLDLKDKEVEQSTSQLIRLLWARWTGGSSRGKRIPNNTNDASPCRAAMTPESTPSSLSSITSPCKEEERFPTPEEISEQLSLRPATPRTPSNPLPRPSVEEKEIVAVETPTQESHQPEESRLNRPALIASDLQVVLDTDTQEGGPPEAEIETPKPAIARVNFKSINTNALPKVRTTVTSPRPLPPGFHKGTNDTKPVQTPRRSSRNNYIPLASPPLRRSLSRDAARSIGAIGVITSSPDQDSVPTSPSPQKLIKKCINFHERDERPLIPGLTTEDWEKALQAAVADCLPPPNFGQILQECSTCGRTFKPDSLQVHRRGCHPPQYARAFSARASPHMIRTRVP